MRDDECFTHLESKFDVQGGRPMQKYGTGSSEVRAQNLNRYWCCEMKRDVGGGQISYFSDITWDLADADGFAPRVFDLLVAGAARHLRSIRSVGPLGHPIDRPRPRSCYGSFPKVRCLGDVHGKVSGLACPSLCSVPLQSEAVIA